MLTTRILKQKCKSVAALLNSEEFGSLVILKGWLKSKRRMKTALFFHIDDGLSTKNIQVVVPPTVELESFGFHSCLSIKGNLVQSPGRQQSVEIQANEVKVIHPGVPANYDFTAKANYDKDDIRTLPHIRPRTSEFAAIFRIRSQMKMNIRKYFEHEGYCRIHTPIMTHNDSEGAGETYNLHMNGKRKAYARGDDNNVGAYDHPVYLTVSGQLHLESMISKGLMKVYTFNPSFRGIESSRFHLNEFWMIESEELLNTHDENNFNTLMGRVENFVKFILKSTLETCCDDLNFVWNFYKNKGREDMLKHAIDNPFIRISHEEAWNILTEGKQKVSKNINKEGELKLCQKYGKSPIFVTRWPSEYKPFYSLKDKNNPDKVFAFDLLAPQMGELVGGGLRENDYHTLYKKMPPSNGSHDFSYYLNIRKKSNQKTGGFGLGFERLLQYVIGMGNIRDTTIFYRGNGQCPS